jgi:hypothetical protein
VITCPRCQEMYLHNCMYAHSKANVKIIYNNNNNNNNHGSTALYGLGPPLSEVTRSLCICGSEGPAHCCAFQLDPDVTARAIWQSVRRLG